MSQDPKQITFEGCAAYGIIPEPAEDKRCEYETIPLARLQPARGSGPTSSPQTSGPHTPALHDHTAVVSGQARSTPPPPLTAHLKSWGEMSTSTSQLVSQPPLLRPLLPRPHCHWGQNNMNRASSYLLTLLFNCPMTFLFL